MIKLKQILMTLAVLAVGALPTLVQADEVENAVESTGYSYKINYPENQLTPGGALKLKMNPKQEQEVTVELENYSDEEITIDLSLNGARTNGNGILEYGPSAFKKDSSMEYDLPDLVTIPDSIKVPAKGKADLILAIKMPEIAYDGIVTGGIEMQKAGQVEAEGSGEGGQTIVNKVAYLFGVTLSMTDKEISPELALQKVYPELANYKNAIFLDVANTTAVKVENLTLDAMITKKGSEEVLYESKKANMSMAPNTLMSYPVSLAGEEMVAGKYTATVTASNGDKEWKWVEDFEITDEDADKFNQGDVNIVQERGLNWKMIALIVVAGLSVVAGGIFVIRLVSKKKGTTSSKKRKK
ncbi:DUF916 and DUF3324 domain-containing protein [Vagococcus sp. BWB3-3]|uniref:DUF916 and DUF3324 domain-containing protein n=1 Tax=Vagococcus allomyrinae TaxID=2794353 RepID=A0A940P8Q9_9ENTE|nr:DUF916 and DUF3324 domain-containing protein [Vagococcus allomyrinae]MBP1040165.1 DUF916 and DUF3324 domain-containing protein [Vagococcus allomyrinae]